ncbi:hypothetical protein AKO1_015614 [Acrasis kona]|uniref:Uncharacterized protein n=1 Tax=Acrasis kona TaxID=1008807 RepID=A0AAW2ZG98_9EUKA
MNVMGKIKRISGSDNVQLECKVLWARRLSFEDALLQTYFTTNGDLLREMLLELYCLNGDYECIQNINEENNNIELDDNSKEKDFIRILATSLKPSSCSYNDFETDERINVQLLLVESFSDPNIGTRKTLCPVMPQSTDYRPQMLSRCNRAAIMVGPWYLEWDESGLVVPRRCVGHDMACKKIIESHDLQGPKTDDALKSLAKVICEWNGAEVTYHDVNRNSQHFVGRILRELGIEFIQTDSDVSLLLQNAVHS